MFFCQVTGRIFLICQIEEEEEFPVCTVVKAEKFGYTIGLN